MLIFYVKYYDRNLTLCFVFKNLYIGSFYISILCLIFLFPNIVNGSCLVLRVEVRYYKYT